MKSIILHAADDDAFGERLQVALDAARALDAHLTCLHVVPFEAYVAMDPFGGAFVSTAALADFRERGDAFRERCEARLGHEDVRWDWQTIDGDPASVLIRAAALADLVVVGQARGGVRGMIDPPSLADPLVVNAGCAVLVVTKGCGPYDPSKPVVVAWNASEQAARAIRQALPLIRLASAVHIVSVDEEDEDFPQMEASSYLSRHGIKSELSQIDRTGRIDELLQDFAADKGADALVMGAYGHSRLRETALGGVTRRLLAHATIPLIMGR